MYYLHLLFYICRAWWLYSSEILRVGRYVYAVYWRLYTENYFKHVNYNDTLNLIRKCFMIPPSVSSSSSLNSPPRHHHNSSSSSSSSSSNRSLKYDLQVEVSKTILPTRLCDYFLILGPGKVIANKNNYTSSNDHHHHQSSSAFYHPTILSSFPDNSFYKKQKSIIPDLLGNNWLLGIIPLYTLDFWCNRNCDRYEVQ